MPLHRPSQAPLKSMRKRQVHPRPRLLRCSVLDFHVPLRLRQGLLDNPPLGKRNDLPAVLPIRPLPVGQSLGDHDHVLHWQRPPLLAWGSSRLLLRRREYRLGKLGPDRRVRVTARIQHPGNDAGAEGVVEDVRDGWHVGLGCIADAEPEAGFGSGGGHNSLQAFLFCQGK